MPRVLYAQKNDGAVHFYDEDGSSLCEKQRVLPEMIVNIDKKIKCSCQECSRQAQEKEKKSKKTPARKSLQVLERGWKIPNEIWYKIHPDANYLAMDGDGTWCAFQHKPLWNDEEKMWIDLKSRWIYPIFDLTIPLAPRAKFSLQRRPKRKNPFRKGVQHGS